MTGYSYVKAHRHYVSQRLIAGFGSRCGCCGYARCPQALHLHHIEPATKCFALRGCIRSWPALVAEAHKCVCLCSNCHTEVHAGILAVDPSWPRFDETIALAPAPARPRRPGRVYGNWAAIDLEVELQRARVNYSAIGRKVGVSGTSVRKRAQRLGYLQREYNTVVSVPS